jgi:ribosomal-protein-alanine N-acetyltransferase
MRTDGTPGSNLSPICSSSAVDINGPDAGFTNRTRVAENPASSPSHIRLSTSRLDLIAATADTVALERQDLVRFAAVLGVPLPSNWPAPLNDEGSQSWYLDLLERDPDATGWALWYLIRREPHRELVGVAGFKGRPLAGVCELGYSILPTSEGNGYATEASRALIRWAFTHDDVERVTAETLPHLIDSIRVMEKCGMKFVGNGHPEEGQPTVRYAVSRLEYAESD